MALWSGALTRPVPRACTGRRVVSVEGSCGARVAVANLLRGSTGVEPYILRCRDRYVIPVLVSEDFADEADAALG